MKIDLADAGLSIEVDGEFETEHLGRALAEICEPGSIIGLSGPLGAGKTRLVRAVAEALGADPSAIASPTFVLIHEYEARIPVYHFDVYRLKSAQEFEDLGAADYWSAGGVCLVEWADRVQGLLPAAAWQVQIRPLGQTRRRFELAFPASAAALASHLGERLAATETAPRFDDSGPAT